MEEHRDGASIPEIPGKATRRRMGRAKRNPSISDLGGTPHGFRCALPILQRILAQSHRIVTIPAKALSIAHTGRSPYGPVGDRRIEDRRAYR